MQYIPDPPYPPCTPCNYIQYCRYIQYNRGVGGILELGGSIIIVYVVGGKHSLCNATTCTLSLTTLKYTIDISMYNLNVTYRSHIYLMVIY